MAIITDRHEMGHRKHEEKCFFCGEYLGTSDALYWMGTEDLWLHPSCALTFVVRLTRDIWEYQNNTSGTAQVITARAYDPERRRHE